MTFVLLTTFTYGQVKKTIDIQTYKNGDTTLWYKWHYELCGQLKINKLISSSDTFHFRFWQDGQALDIWTTDYKTFQGQVTNYIKKYNPNKWKKENPKPNKVIANKINLDTGQAREAYNLIIEYSILTIPTDEKIKGWSHGKDGIAYQIEISTTNSYVFRSYWMPAAQDSLVEAKKIQAFVDKINSQLKLRELYTKLIKTLPNGRYTNDGSGVKIISRKDD